MKALVTGIAGQDGTYLAEHLLSLGYQVYGLVRRDPGSSRWLRQTCERIEFAYGDLRDAVSLEAAFRKAWPDEVYNLAGQVFVPSSWELPSETFDINVGGLVRLLQIIERQKPDTRLYQASSSEMYGNVNGCCGEQTPFNPLSPYGVSKTAAHQMVRIYRQKGIFAVAGILFNHESPRRGPEMVTRKITKAAAGWAGGDRTKLKLGNLQARRDWGFAGDYVKTMHLMLQQKEAKDYVIGTGRSHSVYEFITLVLKELQRCCDSSRFNAPVEDFIEVDQRMVRANEIDDLRADARLARVELGWVPELDFSGLVRIMVESDLAELGVQSQL